MERQLLSNPRMVERIAQGVYRINRAFERVISNGHDIRPRWADADEHEREEYRHGVRYVLANPDCTPAQQHADWVADRREQGWRWGESKDERLRTHPRIIEFQYLPLSGRVQSVLFLSAVRSMVDMVREEVGDGRLTPGILDGQLSTVDTSSIATRARA